MPMVKKSISVTEQDSWIEEHISTGHFGNRSESARELIRERQVREQETPAEIAAIRVALDEGEKSGVSMRTPDEIMDAVITRRRKNGQL